MTPKLSILILTLAVMATTASPAWAQSNAAARQIYELGRKQMADGNYGLACPAFAESQRLDPRPVTLLTLAVCHDRWGKIATAVATFEEFRREFERMPPAVKARYEARARKAELRRTELHPQVPKLTLTLPPNTPPDVEIQRNGVEVSAASLEVPLPMDPGEHVVTTQIGNGPLIEKRITLERGESKEVTLEVKRSEPASPPASTPAAAPAPAPTPAPAPAVVDPEPGLPKPAPDPSASARQEARPMPSAPPPPQAPEVDPQRLPPSTPSITGRQIGALFTGGVGLAGLGLGAVCGAIVLQKKSVVQEHCNGLMCDTEGKDAADSASLPSALSTLGFGLGAAGITTGLILWLTEPAPAATPRLGNGVRPTASADRTSVTVGMKGAW